MHIATLMDFQNAVVLGATTESATLEFKRDLQGFGAKDQIVRDEGALEFVRDITAFANGQGGCQLIGVAERAGSVADSLHRLDDCAARIQWMEQAITRFAEPSTFSMTMQRIVVNGYEIIAVNVQPSIEPVFVYHDGRPQMFVRDAQGKRHLNPKEMERRIMERSRATSLELNEVVTHERMSRPVALVPGLFEWSPTYGYMHVATEAYMRSPQPRQFELCFPGIGNRCIVIPLAFVHASWPALNNQIGLSLTVRVISSASGLRLEPIRM